MLEGIKWESFYVLFAGVLVIPYLIYRMKARAGRAIIFPPAQDYPPLKKVITYYLQLVSETLLILLLVVMLAGPYRSFSRTYLGEEGLDIALVLDISASMQADDFKPNRLESLKKIARAFIKRSGNNRIAVYAFAKIPFAQTPLTTDHSAILTLLDGLTYETIDHAESGGTAMGDALITAVDALERQKVEGRDRAVILISDGENSSGIDPVTAARFARSKGIQLTVIGLAGDEPVEVYINGEPFITVADTILKTSLDDTRLKQIAAAGEGRYFRAYDESILKDIFERLAVLNTTPLERAEIEHRIPLRPQLALPAFVLFLAMITLRGIFNTRPML